MSNYFDRLRSKSISRETDVCNLEDWIDEPSSDFSCALHPTGFMIFLRPNELDSYDEYLNDDPYSVADNINSNFHQRRFKSTIDLIEKYSDSDKLKILDLGCGEGHLTNVIKLHKPTYDVYGLDYSVSAIDYAHRTFSNIDFVVANAYSPPYNPNFFDVVVLNNIWEHVPDPLNLLSVISSIIKTNGLVIISTPSRYRFGNTLRILCGIGTKFVSKLHVTEYTVGQVKEMLRYGGYRVVEAHSPTIREKYFLLSILKYSFFLILKLLRSSHVLESTVFYAAIRLPVKEHVDLVAEYNQKEKN